jgi:DNA repair protein RecO (recombination protein O)
VGLYRDEAIVLRTQKLGEADRIVTLLTRGSGRVRAVAKGVRRTTSRFGSRLEPFTHVDLQLAEGRSLDVVTQAETLDPFAGWMGADYERYTAGTVMLETAERLVVEDKEPALQQFLLLVGALRAMCGTGRAPTSAFSPAAGGMLCSTCRVPGSMSPSTETVVLLGALLAGEWAVVEGSEPRTRREATGMVAAYLQWHLERGLKSLAHVPR